MSAVLKPDARQRPRSRAPQLVPMTHGDIARVLLIEHEIYEFPWTPGNFADSLCADYACWLYLEQNELAGYAVVMLAAGEAHLLNLSIARAGQGRGLGRSLLDALMAAAHASGAGKMLLEVRPSNAAGIALYTTAGFARLGVRKGYYPARPGREDAWVYGRDLPAAAGRD